MPKIPLILFWAAAFFAFAMAVHPAPPQIPASDKMQHMAAFAVLAALASAAYPRLPLLAILVGLAGFGALIEVVQALPQLHRDSDLRDWLADLGAAAAVLVAVRAWRGRERTS